MTSFFRYLDTNGDGSGDKQAIGNYEGQEIPFFIAPPFNQSFEIARLIVTIEDRGVMDSGGYGNGGRLVNGITMRYRDDTRVKQDLTDGIPIVTNAEYARYCYDVQRISWGSGSEYVVVRWTFGKAGRPLILDGSIGDRLEVVLNDDFTRLVSHTFMAQGTIGRGGLSI